MLKLTAKRTKWFTVPQDTSGETKIEILHLKPGVVADIEAKANKMVGKQIGEEFHTEIGFRLNERMKAYVLASVVDWKGFQGINDKALPCNDPNKLSVIKEFGWFGEFVEKCREEYALEVEADEEEAGGN